MERLDIKEQINVAAMFAVGSILDCSLLFQNVTKADVRIQQTRTGGRGRPLEARREWVENDAKASACLLASSHQREQRSVPMIELRRIIKRIINLHSRCSYFDMCSRPAAWQ